MSTRTYTDPAQEGGPIDGIVVSVPHDVYVEVLKHHTLAEVNALPVAERMPLIEAAIARLAAQTRAGAGNDAAAELRAERERRKAEAWAKRQPKGKA